MTANDTQIGGSHYQRGDFESVQHWDYAVSNKMAFLEGSCSKYIARYRFKDGMRDLLKAAHYLDKLIEVAKAGYVNTAKPVYNGHKHSLLKYVNGYELTGREASIIWLLLFWDTIVELETAKERVKELIQDFNEFSGE